MLNIFNLSSFKLKNCTSIEILSFITISAETQEIEAATSICSAKISIMHLKLCPLVATLFLFFTNYLSIIMSIDSNVKLIFRPDPVDLSSGEKQVRLLLFTHSLENLLSFSTLTFPISARGLSVYTSVFFRSWNITF